MWTVTATKITANSRHFMLHEHGRAVPYCTVLELWMEDEGFRDLWSAKLAETEWPGFRWETPPVTETTIDRDFEFVLLRCDSLHRPIDHSAFSEHFENSSDAPAISFANLRGDARLVVPCPIGDDECYGHLAAFVRSGPRSQVDRLWQLVGAEMKRDLGPKPIWLSTAGMGVPWLHVRLDSRPKYYGHQPYKMLSASFGA